MSGVRCGVTCAIADPVPATSRAKVTSRLVFFTAGIVLVAAPVGKRKGQLSFGTMKVTGVDN
jgi:hypothetical protein